MKKNDYNKELHVYKACCLYALTKYDEAKRECQKSKKKKKQFGILNFLLIIQRIER